MVERFPTNAGIVYIGQQKYNSLSMYGSTGVVRSQNIDNDSVDITLSLEPKEKPFGKIIAQKVKEKYFNVRTAAKALGVTPSALGRLMGSLIVMPGRVDIGLNLKVRGNLCLPGYARPIKAPINSPKWSWKRYERHRQFMEFEQRICQTVVFGTGRRRQWLEGKCNSPRWLAACPVGIQRASNTISFYVQEKIQTGIYRFVG